MNSPQSKLDASPSQLPTILSLFIVLRLIILFFYFPHGLFSAYTDYYYYFQTAQLSEQGYYPFINMWYEYPPVLAYLSQLTYWLADRILPMGDIYSFGFQLYFRLLGMIFLVFEAVVLVLIHQITRCVWSQRDADWTAWVYAFLGLPLLFSTYAHQAVPLFFWLLAVYFLISQTGMRRSYLSVLASGFALGLGMAAKFTPAILFAAAIKFLWPDKRRIILYALAMLLTFAAVYAPFLLLGGGEWVMASFRALGSVGSYGTIWAIFDGNWGPGTYGPLERRLQLDLAGAALSRPSVIPGIWLLALFAALYALVFFRRLYQQPGGYSTPARQFIWFSALTSMIFHLWSKGWSPQWAVMIVPLFLLCFPGRRGLRWALSFTGLIIIEWAITTVFSTPSTITFFIVFRTLYFIAFSVALTRMLWPSWRLLNIRFLA